MRRGRDRCETKTSAARTVEIPGEARSKTTISEFDILLCQAQQFGINPFVLRQGAQILVLLHVSLSTVAILIDNLIFTKRHFRRALSIAVIIVPCVFLSSSAQENYGNWSYYCKCSINTKASGANVPGGVGRFPLLVRLTTSNFTFAHALASGGDLRFADTTGKHLPYQLERWSYNDSAEIWVRIDSAKGNDSSFAFFIYYGNSAAADSSTGTAVFDTGNGFYSSWHCNQSPSVLDATANASTGMMQGSASVARCVIGNGLVLDGSSAYFYGSQQTSADPNPFTLSAWFKTAASFSSGGKIMGLGSSNVGNSSAYDRHIWINDDGKLYYGCYPNSAKTIGSASAYKDGTWHYVVATLSTAGEILYVDGQQVGIDATTTTAWPNYTTPYWRVGQDNLNSWGPTPSGNWYFNGSLDEVSVAKAARSSNWVALCYGSQKPGSNAIAIGAEVANVPQYITWVGNGADCKWSTANNWYGQVVPDSTMNVKFDVTSSKICSLDVTGKAKTITFTGQYTGNFCFTSDTLVVYGTASFSTGGAVSAGTGVLKFVNSQVFIPATGQTFPTVLRSGAGTTTLQTTGLAASNVIVQAGTFSLGVGLAHTVAAISGSGALDFGSSTLTDTGASLDLSTFSSVTAGSGTLVFARNNSQTLTLKSGLTLPSIIHSGSGTLQIAGANLSAASFSQTSGTIDLNGHDIQVTGNFSIANGTHTSFAGYTTGRTITVGGNATLNGSSSTTLLYMASAGYDTMAVTGTLTGTYDSIDYNYAKISQGYVSNSIDGTHNYHWNFDPDNYGSWSYQRAVFLNTTVQGTKTSSSISQFPVCIKLSGSNFDFTQPSDPNGADIRFSLSDGTHLTYEKEYWNKASTTAALWVLVPTVQANVKTQFIIMYWGSSSGVDRSSPSTVFNTGSGYFGVWHMTQATPNMLDATSNGDTGKAQNAPVAATGVVGQALTLNGSSQYLYGLKTAAVNPNPFTISTWFKTGASFSTGGKLIGLGTSSTGNSGSYDRHIWIHDDGKIYFGCWIGSASTVGSSSAYKDGNWHYAAATLSSSGQFLFIDGQQVSSSGNTSAYTYGSAPYWRVGQDALGGWTPSPGSTYFNGTLDEVRMETSARSADWIALTYGTQCNGQPAVNYQKPVVFGPGGVANDSAFQTTKDTAAILYRMDDPDTKTDTVSAQVKVAAGSTWFGVTNTAGNSGPVDTAYSTDRTIKWSVRSQLVDTAEGYYNIRVIAVDAGGNRDTSTSSSFYIDTKPPVGLANFRPTSQGVSTVTLGWTFAADPHFDHYEIWYDTDSLKAVTHAGSTWNQTNDPALITATTSTTTIAGLGLTTKYYFKLWAFDSWGNGSTVKDTSASTTPTVASKWSVSNLGAIAGGAMGQNALYISGIGSGSADSIFSINAATGAENWSYYVGGYGTPGYPTMTYYGGSYKVLESVGSTVVGLTDNGGNATQLFAPLNLGAVTVGVPYASPDDSSFYVPYTGNLTKRRLKDGSQLWTVAIGNISTTADIAVFRDLVYFAATDSVVKADAYDLTPMSAYNTGATIALPLLVLDSTMYVTPNNNKLYAVKTSSMSSKWPTAFTLPAANTGPAFYDNGSVYASAGSYVVKVSDGGSAGTSVWQFGASGTVNSGATSYGKTIYFGTSTGYYYAIDDASHGVKTNWPRTGASGNADAGPWVYVPTSPSDTLVIFGTSGNNLDAFKKP